MKGIYSLTFCAFISVGTNAQDSFDKFKQQINNDFDSWVQKTNKDYEDFREKANQEYAELLKKSWNEFNSLSPIPKPKDDEKPPVVISKDDGGKNVKDNPIPIKDDIIKPPVPKPQPDPIVPIKEVPKPSEKVVDFSLYGINMKVRFCDNLKYRLASTNYEVIASAWKKMSTSDYNNTISDCLSLRSKYKLSDWVYLQMLNKMSIACFGNGNEAVILMAYIYCQSGYKMRLGIDGSSVRLLYASEHTIFDKPFFDIDGDKFYTFGYDTERLNICNAEFPQEKPLSLLIPDVPEIPYVKSRPRTLASKRFPQFRLSICTNLNSFSFYNDYPTSYLNGNVVTRWAMYANMPMPKWIKNEMYPKIKQLIQGLGHKDAVERLLNFTQTAFVYEYDNNVWGHDRAFFPEETLYYPYCDCEDRSIFLSRIIRDILGLKCILIFYPGHLALAVNFAESIKGDYIMLSGKKYIVCDPTYIGASIGMTMPNMDNSTAQVILLD